MNRIAVIALVTTLLGSHAFASETVFGLPMGEPLAMRECSKTSLGNYNVFAEGLCYRRQFAHLTGPVLNESVTVGFAFKEWPTILEGKKPEAQIIDGRIESISFTTRGIENQDEVLRLLKVKYGEPDVFEPKTMQNRMGASFDVFTAVWVVADLLTVAYASTAGQIDAGLVTIFTAKAAQHNQAEKTARDAQRREL